MSTALRQILSPDHLTIAFNSGSVVQGSRLLTDDALQCLELSSCDSPDNSMFKYIYLPAGPSIPSKSIMHIAYSPYFTKIYKFVFYF